MSTQPKKIGPYGGPGGQPFNISTPTAFVSVQIWSVDLDEGGVIKGLFFTYIDEKGVPQSSGPWGSTDDDGKHHVINLDQDEHMVSITGTTDGKYITSLKFVTDKKPKPYGPYGAQSEAGLSTFSFPPYIVGFSGRSSEKINAIEAYVIPA
ncbi:unnamed protein product [Urochloa humidicola]